MSAAISIAFECRCGSKNGLLPARPTAASVVRCGACGREHGPLADVREELRRRAREAAAEKAQEIFRVRTGGGRARQHNSA